MILFLIFWILSSGFKGDNQTEIVSRREIVFFMISFLLVSLIPNILFDGETERFSLPVKFVLMLPILAILYFLKKLQSKN
jgi:Ca2+/Na+ antiporter